MFELRSEALQGLLKYLCCKKVFFLNIYFKLKSMYI